MGNSNTQELRRTQRQRTTSEHKRVERSVTSDGAKQHRRRAQQSEYLERKLAEREESERRAKRDRDT
jgi:hypothetical protein